MGFYSSIPILECGEKLIPIPEIFSFTNPHVYVSLGAPYGSFSPFYLRSGVIKRLEAAQIYLQKFYSTWQIKIFDAYRPVSVQEFMVNHTKVRMAVELELDPTNPEQEAELMTMVYKFWAVPSLDPATPPPHSTGAAVDITLVDEKGQDIDMGGEIDEISDRSNPDYYKLATSSEQIQFHHHRQLLWDCMRSTGFQRHPHEWWHFSYGDQMWCWLENAGDRNADQEHEKPKFAHYGKA